MNTVRDYWPPVASERVGFRKEHGPLRESFILPLTGLSAHPHAWWYGCRFVCEEACRLRVRLLRTADDTPVAEWAQMTGEWTPLPWALPGALADCQRMQLVVEPMDAGERASLFFAATAAFIELPQIHPMDRFLFVSENGHPMAHWNRHRKQFGTAQVGDEPAWKSIHTVVPPLQCVLDAVWDRTDIFCIHAWDERLPRIHAAMD